MKNIFFKVNDDNFVVELTGVGQSKYGNVYPIDKWDDKKDWYYQSEKDNSPLQTTAGARCLFSFSFCWRGVWEGRIYFEDDEYWCEELEMIKLLWDEIEKNLKLRIKKENHDTVFDP